MLCWGRADIYQHGSVLANRYFFLNSRSASLILLSLLPYNQTDKIRSLLPARMRVTGLPDSGFLVAYEADGKDKRGECKKSGKGWGKVMPRLPHLDLPFFLGACKYQESMANTFSLMNVASSLPQGCLDNFASSGT